MISPALFPCFFTCFFPCLSFVLPIQKAVVTYDGPRDGTKKVVSGEMPATYQPQYVEAAWQEYWEKAGFYTCDPAKAAVRQRSLLGWEGAGQGARGRNLGKQGAKR